MNYRGMMRSLCALSLISVTTNAAAFEELGKVQLEPMPEPTAALKAGHEWHWIRNGKEHVPTIIAVDGDTYSAEDSLGCKWASLVHGFAPSSSWENCSGSTGTQTITKVKGSPWPLKAKTKFKYYFRGKNAKGESWTGQRTCKVKGQVRVKVPAGEYDTFKLVCKDKWNSRTWWISPELGSTVAWKRDSYNNNSRDAMQELTKQVIPE